MSSGRDTDSDWTEASESTSESARESGIETGDESCEIEVDSQTSEDSSEISQPEIEVDVTDVVTIEGIPADKSGRTSKSSSSEASNVRYEFPDDSEFCESVESFANLRKRPSNSTIESTSKKPCKEVKNETDSRVSIPTQDKNAEKISSGTADKANNNNPNNRSPFLFGCKHKREGESNKSENVAGKTLDSSGRFTKHKGDSKCHHRNFYDCVEACSSDNADADVEDNAEDSSMESRETTPIDTQSLSSPSHFQNAVKDIIKRNMKPASGSKKPKDSSTKDSIAKRPPHQEVTSKKLKDSSTKDSIAKRPHQEVTSKKFKDSSTKDLIAKRPHQEVTSKKKGSSSKTVSKPGETSAESAVAKDKTANLLETSSASKSETSSPESQPTRQKKRRCRVCNKKLGLTATHCRCGGIFCAKHRYDKEHGCTFDYRAMGREEIRKNNPKIVAEKVKKI